MVYTNISDGWMVGYCGIKQIENVIKRVYYWIPFSFLCIHTLAAEKRMNSRRNK
jgi:hypothetical protein